MGQNPQLFVKGTDGGPVLYHGTNLGWFRRHISKEGLRNPVYLTNDFDMAFLFARQGVCPSTPRLGPPVILEVRIPDPSRLRPDLNIYDEPTESLTKRYRVGIDDSLWEAVEAGRVEAPRDDEDWETSLSAVNSVWYDGRIVPRDIVFVHEAECPAHLRLKDE